MKRFLASLCALLTLAALAGAEARLDASALKTFPIQNGGRLKPMDTFARESVKLITGKSRFQKEEPIATVLRWWARPEQALSEQNIEIRDLATKKELGLEEGRRWFSHRELKEVSELRAYADAIHQKRETDEDLTKQEEKAQETLVKMRVLETISEGSALTMIPHPEGLEQSWASFRDLEHEALMERLYPLRDSVEALHLAVADNDQPTFDREVQQLSEELVKAGPMPTAAAMAREVFYNNFHPFRKAWILYLIGFALLLFTQAGTTSPLYWTGLAVSASGFALHAYGFYLRCVIAGRPPVTNMYESVIWVAFGAVLFSLAFEYFYRSRNYLLASTGGAVVCLILADMLPAVLDPSIRPLTPVLRNNFWLTVHVLTITLGYAAFLLALGLGHMAIWKHITRSDQKESLKNLHQALYKSIQVGVLLLAAGTILGGVWANYSWGRFWGWDPKEVWALIALLGYLAILHGRYAGWLREFGMAAWSIIAFQGVLMAWYGVNFVLGAGLHSYGFGNGGVFYVSIYVAIECLFVALATWRYKAMHR